MIHLCQTSKQCCRSLRPRSGNDTLSCGKSRNRCCNKYIIINTFRCRGPGATRDAAHVGPPMLCGNAQANALPGPTGTADLIAAPESLQRQLIATVSSFVRGWFLVYRHARFQRDDQHAVRFQRVDGSIAGCGRVPGHIQHNGFCCVSVIRVFCGLPCVAALCQ